MTQSNPSRTGERKLFGHVHADFLASIVVFLVALPLCIGIAVAVGVSPTRALITGIVGGIIVGFLAGSPLQVSGPAAGLFVIVADLLAKSKANYLASPSAAGAPAATADAAASSYALAVLATAVFAGGVIQWIAGKLGLGKWFRAVSPAVIKGMLAGIGALILISQLHVMLDHRPMIDGRPAQGGLEHIAALPGAFEKALAAEEGQSHHLAAITGMVTIALLVIWPKIAPPRLRLVPSALVAIAAATVFSLLMDFSIQRLIVPENFLSEVSLPGRDNFALLTDASVLTAALVIAIVASAETLLCATAVDQMQNGPRTDYDRELTSQGIGNMLCGLLGALPMTGVIVRSSTNVQAGAKTRLSTMMHGLWLLLFVTLFPAVLGYIPKAALGAMLVFTGYKLLHLKEARQLWKFSKTEAAIFLTTMALIVTQDLLFGVLVGVGLSAMKLLYTFTQLQSQLVVNPDGRDVHLKLHGSATFIRLPQLASDLERVPSGAQLHVEMYELQYVDHACLDLLMNWAKQHEASGGSLMLDWDSLYGKYKRDAAVPLATPSTNGSSRASGNGDAHANRPQPRLQLP